MRQKINWESNLPISLYWFTYLHTYIHIHSSPEQSKTLLLFPITTLFMKAGSYRLVLPNPSHQGIYQKYLLWHTGVQDHGNHYLSTAFLVRATVLRKTRIFSCLPGLVHIQSIYQDYDPGYNFLGNALSLFYQALRCDSWHS